MHVIFISECEGKGIKRTRAILDGYAKRIGNATWQTPITLEALKEIRALLRRRATRQMAVACYLNYGVKRMRLIWTVGNKQKFGEQGEVTIATRKSSQHKLPPKWIENAKKVAALAGYMHDLGKCSQAFAHKITPGYSGTSSDPIRHEIISAVILKKMNQGESWQQSWANGGSLNQTKRITNISESPIHKGILFEKGIQNVFDAILYGVATHHKLFYKNTLYKHISVDYNADILLTSRDSGDIEKLAQYKIKEIQQFSNDTQGQYSADYWHGLAWVARASLILADHQISADKTSWTWKGEADESNKIFANTKPLEKNKKINGVVHTSAYNQTLATHLSGVGNKAKEIAENIITMRIPSVSEITLSSLLKKAPEKYDWQNKAAKALNAKKPTLVMNIASTGAGKTKMNARAVAVLAGDRPLSFSVVLPLRSLTLQTGEAYAKDLNIKKNELVVVMGGTTTQKLAEYEKNDQLKQKDIEETEDNDDIVLEIDGSLREPPEWLAEIIKNSRSTQSVQSVLMSPILVSTTDTIIKAGDPSKQASHAMALIRVMHADLIVDEIDSYEPKSLASVLRLIFMAAMFGRNVVVSSGTMPDVIATAVWESYASGRKVYNEMNQNQDTFECVIIDDSVPASRTHTALKVDFEQCYQKHLNLLQEVTSQTPATKKGKIVEILTARANSTDTIKNVLQAPPTSKNITDAIKKSCQSLHEKHAWKILDNKNISFGLVRIANISRAIEVAEILEKEPNTFVCCYHARHLMMQRYNIERNLDQVLKRCAVDWKKELLNNKDIQTCLQTDSKEIKIIIVATPVEEVGRDHDFDWAVIEPSSTQSIVQCAGRVNRHRKDPVDTPNIHILQYNFRTTEKENYHEVFQRPGYESENSHEHLKDMFLLINDEKIQQRLDSSLRFDINSHKFSKYDSTSIQQSLTKWVNPFIYKQSQWMDGDFYQETSLRETNKQIETWIYQNNNKWAIQEQTAPSFKLELIERNGGWVDNKKSLKGLFTLDIQELRKNSEEAKIDINIAMMVNTHNTQKNKHEMTRFGIGQIKNE